MNSQRQHDQCDDEISIQVSVLNVGQTFIARVSLAKLRERRPCSIWAPGPGHKLSVQMFPNRLELGQDATGGAIGVYKHSRPAALAVVSWSQSNAWRRWESFLEAADRANQLLDGPIPQSGRIMPTSPPWLGVHLHPLMLAASNRNEIEGLIHDVIDLAAHLIASCKSHRSRL